MDSDGALLDKWRDGDSASGNALLARHFGSIRRFFASKIAPGDVEELVQKTFTGCIEAAADFRGDGNFRAYLFGIARRTLYKHLRNRSRDASRSDPDLGVSSVRALGQSPTSVVAEREREGLVLQALQQLPVAQQTLLELHYWESLDAAAIGDVLELTPGNVRVKLHRARAMLLEVLARDAGPVVDEGGLDALARALGRLV